MVIREFIESILNDDSIDNKDMILVMDRIIAYEKSKVMQENKPCH